MKISLEWLSQYLPGPLDASAAGEALTNGGLPVESIESVGADTVLDVEVTSNRGDCLSHLGVARELAALLDRKHQEPAADRLAEAQPAASDIAGVRIDAPALCPHYTARIIRGVRVGPSPEWMARRLAAVGLRPINNIVDVTNYVMFELGQPLHAFDFDRLAGGQIIVRAARPGETLTSIDGKVRQLQSDMLVIADAAQPVALAGVMGGKDSEVSERTVNVLLESARFDPLSVRKTARALDMRSDSSYRFERGIDPTLPARASRRAAELILQTAGGQLLAGVLSAGEEDFQPLTLFLRLAKLKAVLGIELPVDRVMDALRRVRLQPRPSEGRVECTIPSDRLDLRIEVDLIEEVARIIGYDRVPIREEIAIRVVPPDPVSRTVDLIRTALVAGGYFEAITFSWVSDLLADDFAPVLENQRRAGLARVDAAVRKADARLRPSLLPGLLEVLRRNENVGNTGARIFEAGSTFWLDIDGKPIEKRRLAVAGGGDYRKTRGVVETLLDRLDHRRAVEIVADARSGFAAGACGRIVWGGLAIGHIGMIDRAIADKLSLREIPAAAELELAPLLEGCQPVPQLQALPAFPAAPRDLSLVLSDGTAYQALEQLITSLKPQWLQDVHYVTTYRGKPLEKGFKSVTLRLIFRSESGTLTGEQVEASVARIISAAQNSLGATVRA